MTKKKCLVIACALFLLFAPGTESNPMNSDYRNFNKEGILEDFISCRRDGSCDLDAPLLMRLIDRNEMLSFQLDEDSGGHYIFGPLRRNLRELIVEKEEEEVESGGRFIFREDTTGHATLNMYIDEEGSGPFVRRRIFGSITDDNTGMIYQFMPDWTGLTRVIKKHYSEFPPEDIEEYEEEEDRRLHSVREDNNDIFDPDDVQERNRRLQEGTNSTTTTAPTAMPSARPTDEPSSTPTNNPTTEPTAVPSSIPTGSPTSVPTVFPTMFPTVFPTNEPTALPSESPTGSPTSSPTTIPTALSSTVENNGVFDPIDVLVLWTKRAECKVSRLGTGCVPTLETNINMRGLIRLAIRETNTAFKLSGISTTLKLKLSFRHPTYTERIEYPLRKALRQMTEQGDGVLEEVHRIRQLVKADVVVMIADDSTGKLCGNAYLGPNKSRMFSVTNWQCATGYFTFGHEIAHNLGCKHDRGAQKACDKADSKYGWRDPNARFRSVMGTNCKQNQCTGGKGGGCPRIQRFSGPVSVYNGNRMGDIKNNNAAHINQVAREVSNYF